MLKTQRLVLALTVIATLATASVPRTADACGLFKWLFPGRNATTVNRPIWTSPTYTTNYAPTSCQPACNTCVQPQTTVQYVPQTAYRTSYNRVPVTVYRPTTQTDPCTNCPVTVMQPCTTWNWQAQRVPYTTYRPVYQTVQRPVSSCCSPVATTNYAAPSYASPGCSSCSAASSYPSMPTQPSYPSAPAQPSYQQAPTYPAYPAPNTQPSVQVPADNRPTLTPGPATQQQLQRVPADNNTNYNNSIYNNGAAQPTYPNTQQQQPQIQQKPAEGSTRYQYTPIPDPKSSSTGDRMRANVAPRLLNPLDRSAMMPVRRASLSTPIAWPTAGTVQRATAIQAPALDDSGWEAVGR